MNRKQIETQWLGVMNRLKSARAKLYGAVHGEWLAKLRLRDNYAKKRSS
jgi:hypothetical protein